MFDGTYSSSSSREPPPPDPLPPESDTARPRVFPSHLRSFSGFATTCRTSDSQVDTAPVGSTAAEPGRVNVGLLACLVACLDLWSLLALAATWWL